MAQAKNARPAGTGLPTSMQHLSTGYRYRGNGPFLKSERGSGSRHGYRKEYDRHLAMKEALCDRCLEFAEREGLPT